MRRMSSTLPPCTTPSAISLKECEDFTTEEEQHSTIMPCLEKLTIHNCGPDETSTLPPK
ncbi:hypothetical protein ACS0TY_020698 [Phlomoides rotata]